MSDDISVLKVYDNEMEASMAQELLENAGIKANIMKDDGGVIPSLQMSSGVSVIVDKADEERAAELLQNFNTSIVSDEGEALVSEEA
jgi:hypothetical protein